VSEWCTAKLIGGLGCGVFKTLFMFRLPRLSVTTAILTQLTASILVERESPCFRLRGLFHCTNTLDNSLLSRNRAFLQALLKTPSFLSYNSSSLVILSVHRIGRKL
jgi:hypothetical protein